MSQSPKFFAGKSVHSIPEFFPTKPCETKLCETKPLSFSKVFGGRPSKYLVWVDIETACLNYLNAIPLEIACIVTDFSGKECGFFNVVIHYDEETLNRCLVPWTLEQHTSNKLLSEVRKSELSLEDADSQFTLFLKEFLGSGHQHKFRLAGSSVQFDQHIIRAFLPKTSKLLHFQILDVTSLRSFFSFFCPGQLPKKQTNHRAGGDIYDSLNLYRHYAALMDRRKSGVQECNQSKEKSV